MESREREVWGAVETLPRAPLLAICHQGPCRQLSCQHRVRRPHLGSWRHPQPTGSTRKSAMVAEEAPTNRKKPSCCFLSRKAVRGLRHPHRIESCAGQHTSRPSDRMICPLADREDEQNPLHTWHVALLQIQPGDGRPFAWRRSLQTAQQLADKKRGFYPAISASHLALSGRS